MRLLAIAFRSVISIKDVSSFVQHRYKCDEHQNSTGKVGAQSRTEPPAAKDSAKIAVGRMDRAWLGLTIAQE